MLEIIPIDTPSLGDRSYLVHDGRVALVVDPQRDLDRVLALAEQHGVRITHVFETHIHNDYVTGGLALATATGAAYHVNADDPVTFARVPVRDGDAIQVAGTMRVRVLATPGHTFTHLAYVLEVDAVPVGVFTGGSLLHGSTGRPDLLGPGDTPTLVRLQFGSARQLAAGLPDATPVLPTHGFGSLCSATQAEGTSSTIGQEKRGNPALTLGESDYAEALLAGLDVWPAYYAHMAPANLAGPHTPDLSPPAPADARELRRRLDAGEWVVDVRSRAAFAAGHVPGTLSFSLDGSFATYLGWLIPWGMPLTLLGETSGQVAEAQRELARIGIDRPAAAAAGPPGRWAGGTPLVGLCLASLRELAAAREDGRVVVLDVRRRLEWSEGHIAGAVHIPLHELPRRLGDVPAGQVWVVCHSGYRATVAASMLAAHGRDVVAVDDEFDSAAAAGLPLEQPVASRPTGDAGGVRERSGPGRAEGRRQPAAGDAPTGQGARATPHDALPAWRRVLAVVAHPDDESFGLGGLLDAFHEAGAEITVLCFTHGEASTLRGVPGDLRELHAARWLDLPVLGWTIPSSVAEALNAEFGTRFTGCHPSGIHLTVGVDRARQRQAAHAHPSQALPTSALWRRLELLGNAERLRWLRVPAPPTPPGAVQPWTQEMTDAPPLTLTSKAFEQGVAAGGIVAVDSGRAWRGRAATRPGLPSTEAGSYEESDTREVRRGSEGPGAWVQLRRSDRGPGGQARAARRRRRHRGLQGRPVRVQPLVHLDPVRQAQAPGHHLPRGAHLRVPRGGLRPRRGHQDRQPAAEGGDLQGHLRLRLPGDGHRRRLEAAARRPRAGGGRRRPGHRMLRGRLRVRVQRRLPAPQARPQAAGADHLPVRRALPRPLRDRRPARWRAAAGDVPEAHRHPGHP